MKNYYRRNPKTRLEYLSLKLGMSSPKLEFEFACQEGKMLYQDGYTMLFGEFQKLQEIIQNHISRCLLLQKLKNSLQGYGICLQERESIQEVMNSLRDYDVALPKEEEVLLKIDKAERIKYLRNFKNWQEEMRQEQVDIKNSVKQLYTKTEEDFIGLQKLYEKYLQILQYDFEEDFEEMMKQYGKLLNSIKNLESPLQ